ncbi:MAG: ATP synthase F1 subunit delta [Duncaniella sp.]|nr:ATP synthase F1 subunit delta [Duncaniella sp.]
MNQGLIPARYAKAIYEYAAERGDDKQIFTLMQTLEASFKDNPELQKVIANPFVASAEKCKLLTTASGHAAAGSETFGRFLGMLASNRRLDASRDIALAYLALYRRQHNIRLVTITSAAPLTAAEQERLRAIIQKRLGSAKMEYRAVVDAALIGGFTVSIDNEKLDASVANELKQLRLSLLSK